MDPARWCPQTNRQTGERTGGRREANIIFVGFSLRKLKTTDLLEPILRNRYVIYICLCVVCVIVLVCGGGGVGQGGGGTIL